MKQFFLLFKRFTSLFSGSDPFKLVFHPFRDWWVLTVLFFVLFLGSVAFHGYMFTHIDEQEGTGGAQSGDIVDMKRLQKVIDFFDAKEIQFARLRTEKPKVVDPSL